MLFRSRHVSVSTTHTLVGPPPATRKVVHSEPAGEMSVDEEEEERLDAVCPIYDQLSLKPWWWILEIFPIEQRRQLKDNRWKKYTS